MVFTKLPKLKNSLVHPKGKQQKSRQSNVVCKICCNPNIACQDAYIGETSQPLQHRLSSTVDVDTIERIQQSSNT